MTKVPAIRTSSGERLSPLDSSAEGKNVENLVMAGYFLFSVGGVFVVEKQCYEVH